MGNKVHPRVVWTAVSHNWIETQSEHIWIQSCVLTQTEDLPLSPKVLNSSLPARALEAAANILLTPCNRKQKTAQTDEYAVQVQFVTNLLTRCDGVNIPVLLKFSSAAFLQERKQKRLVNKASITRELFFMHPSFIHLNVCRIAAHPPTEG